MALTDTFVKTVKHTVKAAGDRHSDGGVMYLHVTESEKQSIGAWTTHLAVSATRLP